MLFECGQGQQWGRAIRSLGYSGKSGETGKSHNWSWSSPGIPSLALALPILALPTFSLRCTSFVHLQNKVREADTYQIKKNQCRYFQIEDVIDHEKYKKMNICNTFVLNYREG